MNLSAEIIGTLASVGGFVLFAIFKFMQNVNLDTTERIEQYESKASKKLEEIQAVATYLQGQVVSIQAKNIELLHQLLDMENRETQREKELGETKAETIKAQASETHAKHLQADAEKERDLAIEAKKQALELVEIQNKAIQELNASVAKLKDEIHAIQVELTEWKNKYSGALEMVGALRIIAPAPVVASETIPIESSEPLEIEAPKEGLEP